MSPLPATSSTTLRDALREGMGTNWTVWGAGAIPGYTTNLGFSVIPFSNTTGGSYGGFTSTGTVDLTGRYSFILVQQPLARSAGAVQTLELQADATNYLEIGLIDASLMARVSIAGTLTTLASMAYPPATGGTIWLAISESGGTLTFSYAYTNVPQQQNWLTLVALPRSALPFAITALYTTLVAGTYAPVDSVGVSTWNSLNWISLPSSLNTSPAVVKPPTGSAATLTVIPPVDLAGASTAQASTSALSGQPYNRTPLVAGQTLAQASTSGVFGLGVQTLAGATVTQATSTSALSLRLSGAPLAKAAPTATLTTGPSMSGAIVVQAKSTAQQLAFGLILLAPAGIIIGFGTTLCQTLILTRYPLSGLTVGQGSTTTLLGQSNAVIAPMGILAAGSYAVKTCCRSDVTGTPAALVFAVTVGGSVVVTTTVYAAGDVPSASYPTAYANYAAGCSFNLNVPSEVVFQWSNPGTYHAPGKHVWIKGVQLHRLS